MLYTISEISNLTGLSKVSIYKKLKLKEMQEHLTKKQGITYVDDMVLTLILDSLKLKDKVKTELNNKEIENTSNDYIEPSEEDLTIKTDYINYLKAENDRLWSELQEKNLQLNNMNRLVENGQILLKEKPQQDLLQLEEHFTELDSKLVDLRQQMQERKKQQEQQPKGIFQKIFQK